MAVSGQLVELTPGTEYLLKIRAKGDGSGVGRCHRQGLAVALCARVVYPPVWKNYEFRFSAPQGG